MRVPRLRVAIESDLQRPEPAIKRAGDASAPGEAGPRAKKIADRPAEIGGGAGTERQGQEQCAPSDRRERRAETTGRAPGDAPRADGTGSISTEERFDYSVSVTFRTGTGCDHPGTFAHARRTVWVSGSFKAISDAESVPFVASPSIETVLTRWVCGIMMLQRRRPPSKNQSLDNLILPRGAAFFIKLFTKPCKVFLFYQDKSRPFGRGFEVPSGRSSTRSEQA